MLYLTKLVTTDTALLKYLKCDYDNIFLPKSKKTNRDRNTERVQKYSADIEVWKEHHKKRTNRKNHPRWSKAGKPMKRMLSFPKGNSTIFR